MAIGASAQAIPPNVRVVDQNAPGPGEDGLTWATAFRDLQDGLAVMNPGLGIDEIWVAQGTYEPDGANPGARSLSFDLLVDVSLFGGFPTGGGDDTFGARDPNTFVSILSGDLLGNDDPNDPFGPTNDENSFHVMTSDVDETARLDGFTISGGNADGAGLDQEGGGASIRAPSPPATTPGPVISQCIFEKNQAQAAGAIFYSSSVEPILRNCIVRNNQAVEGGGVLAFGDLVLINCLISSNLALRDAGGVGCLGELTMVSCRVVDNEATSFSGGGVGTNFVVNSPSPKLINCLFSGNIAGTDGGGLFARDVDTMINCTFSDNTAGGNGGGVNTTHAGIGSTQFYNCIAFFNIDSGGSDLGAQVDMPQAAQRFHNSCLQGLVPPLTNGNINVDPQFAGAGNYRLFCGSPCIDAADTTKVPADGLDVDEDLDLAELTPDLDLKDRALDDPDTPDTGIGGPPVVDMGSYEFVPCPSDINGDCEVNVLDLIALLLCFGQPAIPGCEAEDVNNDGTVNVLDLISVLLDFGTSCVGADPEAQSQSLEEALGEAGLTMNDWDAFMVVIQNGTQEEKDNWHCWMLHYLSCHDPFGTCNPPPPNCPGSDPFDGHRH